MSSNLFAKVWQRPFSGLILGMLLLLLLLNGGCGSRQVGLVDPGGYKKSQAVYDGKDDEVPLTPVEQKALNSTGQLDRGLSQAALQDVAVQYKHFLRKGRTTMERFSQRAEAYLGHARQVFREHGLPEELAFLAIVESGYNAKAVSPAGAAGAWQFMPYTGMKYGLNQDWWMDERLDPYKSAEAAADYLAKLHGDFRDWHLAIAAYNAGEGKISRALEGTGAKTFFELKEKNHKLNYKAQLRDETQKYVPRFLAISKIMRNLNSLGFDSVKMNKESALVRVEVRPGTDLMGMAKAVRQEWSEFRDANMAHKRYVTHVNRSTYIYVPAGRQATATAYAAREQDDNGWKSLVVGKGDNWQSLSRKTNIPVAALQAANRTHSSLRPGTRVRLPAGPDFKMPAATHSVAATTVQTKAASPGTAGTQGGQQGRGKNSAALAMQAAAASTGVHTLESGDTLHAVAKQYNTDVATLLALNSMEDPNRLRAGQKLRVPNPTARGRPVQASEALAEKSSTGSLGAPTAKNRGKQLTYVVQAGDTLWGIARKHNLSAQQLQTLNKNQNNAVLRPGDKLLVSEH